VLGPVFIQGRITAQSYTDFLHGELQDLLDALPLAVSHDFIYQQDGHPAHTSNMAVAALQILFPDRWLGVRGPTEWPARSPDKTIMDFFFWGFVKTRIYQNPPNTREEMEAAITDAFRAVTLAMLANARSFMRRVALCLEQEGGHFEHLL